MLQVKSLTVIVLRTFRQCLFYDNYAGVLPHSEHRGDPIYDSPSWDSAYGLRGHDLTSESSCHMEKNPIYMIGTKEHIVFFETGNEHTPPHVYDTV